MEINAVKRMYDDCAVTPSYAEVVIHFKDDEESPITTTICFNNKAKSLSDERIFFYTKNFNSFIDLLKAENGEDFEIDDVIDIF